METERDLLPWIFAGVLLTTLAVGASIVLAKRPAAAAVAPTSVIPFPQIAVAPVVSTSPPLSPPLPGALVAAVAVAGAVDASAAPANRIWECDVGGRKIFADSPCSDHASIREIGAINGMAPVRVAASGNPSWPAYAAAGPYPEAADNAVEPLETQGGNVYWFTGASRRDHLGRHHPHERGPHGVRR